MLNWCRQAYARVCRGNREKEKERESADDTEEIRYEKNEKDINWKIRKRNIQNDLEISIQTEKHVIHINIVVCFAFVIVMQWLQKLFVHHCFNLLLHVYDIVTTGQSSIRMTYERYYTTDYVSLPWSTCEYDLWNILIRTLMDVRYEPIYPSEKVVSRSSIIHVRVKLV